MRLFDLSEGGMGSVSLAVRQGQRFERLYAIKRLLPELREQPDMRAMFLEEGRVAGLLHHPNVVGVTDVGQDAEGPFMVMDYIEGVSARDLIVHAKREAVPLPLLVVCEIVTQVAKGLAVAHNLSAHDGKQLGLVHRDVSPHNILIGFDGVVRLADFGVARAEGRDHKTSTGVLKGKIGYMAPEALQFHEPTAQSDLFSLGVVIYELLSGNRLYGGKNVERARRIVHEAPPDIGDERDDVPVALQALLLSLLAKDPRDRPGSATEVVAQTEQLLVDVRQDPHAIGVAEYLDETFAQVRASRRREIELALIAHGQAQRSAQDDRRRDHGRRRALRSAGVVALVLGALGTGAFFAFGREPQRAQVSLSIASDPPGAVVTSPGLPRLSTPTRIDVPSSSEALTLLFEAPGFEPLEQRVIPANNLQLHVQLVALGRSDVDRSGSDGSEVAGGAATDEQSEQSEQSDSSEPNEASVTPTPPTRMRRRRPRPPSTMMSRIGLFDE